MHKSGNYNILKIALLFVHCMCLSNRLLQTILYVPVILADIISSLTRLVFSLFVCVYMCTVFLTVFVLIWANVV